MVMVNFKSILKTIHLTGVFTPLMEPIVHMQKPGIRIKEGVSINFDNIIWDSMSLPQDE
jgi:hypothetical protein